MIEVEIKDLEEFIELSKDDPSELDEIKNQLIDTEQKIIDLEEESLYSEEFDNHSAVLTVNAGAGGVDAHDWAEMLLRMYTRFLDNNNMKYDIEEISTGEEAGIKSGSIRIDNYRAYANLESERGVHRLVRISPFDSNKRRHTSFAGVDVVPLIDDSDEFDLNGTISATANNTIIANDANPTTDFSLMSFWSLNMSLKAIICVLNDY